MLVSFCNQITDNPGTSAQPSWLAEDANSPPLAFHGLTVFLAQAHRSAMVSAVGANAGLITCGIFGSIMWWPEAELRSCVEAAGMRLPSEERARSFTAGKESPRSAMSKVLRRYFTPSSAALAQATLERMHSSGDLQGSVSAADGTSTQPQNSEHADSRQQLTASDQAQTGVSDEGTSSCRLPPPPPPHPSPPTQQSTAAHMLSCQIFGLILRVLHTLVSGTVGTTMLYYVLVPCKH